MRIFGQILPRIETGNGDQILERLLARRYLPQHELTECGVSGICNVHSRHDSGVRHDKIQQLGIDREGR
jgi:hypothetical protein